MIKCQKLRVLPFYRQLYSRALNYSADRIEALMHPEKDGRLF